MYNHHMTEHRISLYIPCYNAAHYIKDTLEAVLGQSRPPDEIIVIDDGGSDNISAVLEGFPVRLLAHDGNKGLSAARNTGVQGSKHDWVVCLDADCTPREDWLETLARRLSTEDVAGVGGQLLELFTETPPDAWRALHLGQSLGPEELRNPPYLFGHGALFRKSSLTAVGLYDERLRTNAEDCYISERLKQAGYQLLYDPEAVVFHRKQDTWGSVIRTSWKWNFFGYFHEITLFNTLRRCAYEILVGLPKMLKVDFVNRRPNCAVISVLAVFYSVGKNVAHYFRHRGEEPIFAPK